MRIDDGTFLAGSLPRTAARLVRDWIDLHDEELMANWQRAQAMETLGTIEPLQ